MTHSEQSDVSRNDWLGHPLTQQLVRDIENAKTELAKGLIEGNFTTSTIDATAIKHASVIGINLGFCNVLELIQGDSV
jgi:hypothetical protein